MQSAAVGGSVVGVVGPRNCVWLMIAFITCKSSLVRLLEGLCSSNPCSFGFSVFCLRGGECGDIGVCEGRF